MTEHQLSLASFYAGWDVYQQHLIAAIAPLTSEQLALRSSPHNWSVGQIAAHIVASRVDHFHLWMGEGSGELAALAEWHEEGQPVRSASELVIGLERSWQIHECSQEVKKRELSGTLVSWDTGCRGPSSWSLDA